MLNKKIKEILIGTNNVGKLEEIRGLLPKSTKVFSIRDFKLKNPKENGKSFLQNSLITRFCTLCGTLSSKKGLLNIYPLIFFISFLVICILGQFLKLPVK